MLNHIMVGSGDIEKSKTFYNAVLGVLGAGEPMAHVNDTGQTRLFYTHDGSTFSVSEPINGKPVQASNGSTIGFVCNSPEQVQELHDVAVANGGTSIEDPPGLREGSMGPMYLCYFTDPDGHKICGLHRPA
ncbi:VOC family protein [Pontixanthobacter aquaemixtae]|uniref:VOC family protein n=1 Tax=Pontixanthobacter aquaemixtae TaxID=1958940 RepID=A0A844ZNU9_9SPHN|nr:VOC family protein [Pontixanthobacter aquaemixtae]MXO89224.1 VOC family protein [Pontixanthobacter aquaemixtae]